MWRPPSATSSGAPRRKGLPVGPTPRGLFVTIEGLDFSGKSTLARALKQLLSGQLPPTRFTREPGGTPAAERIREVVLDLDMDVWTEAYLYAAARADLARLVILPSLLRGENVVCDRYLDSSLAYQGFGRGLGVEAVRELNAFAVETVMPDRTFYLRLDEAERVYRARTLGAPLDRIERAGGDFTHRVEEGFEELARREPARIRVLDATRPPEELAEVVRREMEAASPYTPTNGV